MPVRCALDHARAEEVPLRFAVRTDPEGVLHLTGELDTTGASVLARALDPLTVGGAVIQLDLSDLTFMDSTGINALCNAAQRLGDRGRIVLVDPTSSVRRLLEITGLDDIFDIDDAPSSR